MSKQTGGEPEPAASTAAPPDLEAGMEPSALVEAVMGASRTLVAVAARSLAEVADEVTLAQYRALVVIATRGPQRSAALAEALAVTPSTATRMCDRLVRKGLVNRDASPSDRREVILALTLAGQHLVDEVSTRRRAELAQVLSKIPVAEQQDMVALFEKLARAAGDYDCDAPATWDL